MNMEIVCNETSENSSMENKKRPIEEDVEPLLIRIPSNNPSCSSDIIRINKNKFKIGRKPDNDEIILSVWISRNHCILHKDENSNDWLVTNLSSTDTLINKEHINRNECKAIKEGDVLQLSLADTFKYKFTLVKKEFDSVKQPRLESNNCELGVVLNNQRSFVECQQNERKDLENQLIIKQQEQENLKQELEKLLQDQKVTKSCNDDLNNQILDLRKKIEIGNSTELELQQKYRDLLQKLEEEQIQFERVLAEEKQRWQEVLRETKQEKEQLELSMAEQMEELREKVEKKQQEEWQKKIDNLLQEEKSVQIKLQDEKHLLEQKLKDMEEALKEKENMQNQLISAQPVPIENCIFVEILQPQTNEDHTIIDSIDLTVDNDVCPEAKIIDKVNHIMDEQLTCSICSELFVRAMTLNCMHTFCRYCIDMWIKKQRICPNCRSPISSMTRSLVVDNFIDKMLESLTPEQLQKRQQLIKERNATLHLHTRNPTKNKARRK